MNSRPQIADLKVFFIDTAGSLPKNFLFCRVEADDGTVGWGEAYAITHRERGLVEYIKALGRMLQTLADPSPENFRAAVLTEFDKGHTSIDFTSATGALEVALWDIKGKQAGKPVCELLGPVRTRTIPLYANMELLADDESIADLAERCIAVQRAGYDAVKIYPMDYGDLPVATECVRVVRETIGAEAKLLVDLWGLPSPEEALAAADAFAPFDLYWFEEPVVGERIAELATLREQIDMPIVTGERQTGIHHFQSILEQQATDILNPDIIGAGGIQSLLEISRLAEPYDVRISPHCWNSTLMGTAAMLHAMAVMPNALIGECFPHYIPFMDEYGKLRIDITDGTAMIGAAPGLGVEMNDSALARHEV